MAYRDFCKIRFTDKAASAFILRRNISPVTFFCYLCKAKTASWQADARSHCARHAHPLRNNTLK